MAVVTPPRAIMASEPWAAARTIGSSMRAQVGYSATSQLKRLWSVARPRVIHW
jgi:hypothetical protein